MTVNSKTISKKIPKVILPLHQRFDVETFCHDIPISVLDKGIRLNIGTIPLEKHPRLYEAIKRTYPKCSWVDLAADRTYLDISFQTAEPETVLDQSLNFDGYSIVPTSIISNRNKLSLILFSGLPDKLTPTSVQRSLAKSISRLGKLVKFTLFEFEDTKVLAPLAAAVFQFSFSPIKTPKAQLKILMKRIPFPIVFKGEIAYCAACNKLGHPYCGFVKGMSLVSDFWVPFYGTEVSDSSSSSSSSSLTITNSTVLSDQDFRTIQSQIIKHGGLPLKEYLTIRKLLQLQLAQLELKKYLADYPSEVEIETNPNILGSISSLKNAKKSSKKRKDPPIETTDAELPKQVAKPKKNKPGELTSESCLPEGPNQLKGPNQLEEPNQLQEPDQLKQSKKLDQHQNLKQLKKTKVLNQPLKPKQSKLKELKQPKQPKEPKQPKQLKEPKQPKQPKQPKEPKQPKQPKEPKQIKLTAQSDTNNSLTSNKYPIKWGPPSKELNQLECLASPSIVNPHDVVNPLSLNSASAQGFSVDKSPEQAPLLNSSQTETYSFVQQSQASLGLSFKPIGNSPSVVTTLDSQAPIGYNLSPTQLPTPVDTTQPFPNNPSPTSNQFSNSQAGQESQGSSRMNSNATPVFLPLDLSSIPNSSAATSQSLTALLSPQGSTNNLPTYQANIPIVESAKGQTFTFHNYSYLAKNTTSVGTKAGNESDHTTIPAALSNIYQLPDKFGTGSVAIEPSSPAREHFHNQPSYYGMESNLGSECVSNQPNSPNLQECSYLNRTHYNHEYTQEPSSQFYPPESHYQSNRDLYASDQIYNQSYIQDNSQLNSDFGHPQVQDYTNQASMNTYQNQYVTQQDYSNLNYSYHQSVPSYHLPYNNQGLDPHSVNNLKYSVPFPNSNQPPPQPSETSGSVMPNYTHTGNFPTPNSLNPLYSNSDSNSVYQ